MKFTALKTMSPLTTSRSSSTPPIVLERPLLIKGEPGTGKTVLAEESPKALGAPLLTWHIKSTTRRSRASTNTTRCRGCATASLATPGLRHQQLHQARKAWEAFTHEKRPVLLIDEIDKADIEFPNDLLLELDRMEFFVYETGENIKAKLRPIVE